MDATHTVWFGTGTGQGTAQASITASILNPSTVVVLTAGPTISAGTTDRATGVVVFSNSNGLSFGMNLGTVTGSYTVPSTAGLLSAIKLSAGAQSSNLSAVTFSNSNGVSFGLSNGTITASVATAAGGSLHLSAGTTQNILSDVVFSNSGGVSFGLNGSTITATVKTDYQSSGAYLTTAALSQDSSKYAGTNGAITGGSITLNTSGLSINLPAYLTTAQPIGAYLTTAMKSDAVTLSNINLSGGTTSGNISAFTLSDANGISFGFDGTNMSATVRTNYQSAGAYLTTAALSQDSSKYAGINGAITGGSITVNTSGVSINLPAYLTTAAPAGAYLTTARASNDAIGLNTARTNVTWTVNSSGISMDARAYVQNGFTTTTTTGTVLVGTLNSAGFSLGVPVFLTTAQSSGAYLTTAALSQDSSKYAGINGAITNGSITVNTSGVSINLPAYLTTAMQSQSSSVFAKTGFTSATTAGTAIVATHNTDGLSMGVPAFITTAMASNAATISNINVSAGTLSNNLSAIVFSNSNSISFGLSGSTITASMMNPLINGFIWEPSGQTSTGQISASNASVFPLAIPYDITFSRVDLHCLISLSSSAASNTAAMFVTSGMVIYSVSGSSTLNPIAGALGSATYSWASGTANFSNLTGGRIVSFPIATTLAAGQYYIVAQMSTTTGSFVGAANTTALGASISMIYGLTNTGSNFIDMGSTTASSIGFVPMRGMYSSIVTATAQTIRMSEISVTGNPGARANIAINFRNW